MYTDPSVIVLTNRIMSPQISLNGPYGLIQIYRVCRQVRKKRSFFCMQMISGKTDSSQNFAKFKIRNQTKFINHPVQKELEIQMEARRINICWSPNNARSERIMEVNIFFQKSQNLLHNWDKLYVSLRGTP